ncbi:MAG: GNAT family N-acetyltransferase [Bacilli bacterium]|nr:GNAT family N-acetyltransferase [Bacilli bacterium]
MLINFTDEYYDILCSKVKDFDISYLLNENAFNNNFLYIIDNLPCGLISFSVIYDRIELNYIWVDNKFRNKGIASKMMDYMCNIKKIINITLEVRVDNIAAINLYKKYGFKIVATRKKYYGNTDAFLMMKEMM